MRDNLQSAAVRVVRPRPADRKRIDEKDSEKIRPSRKHETKQSTAPIANGGAIFRDAGVRRINKDEHARQFTRVERAAARGEGEPRTRDRVADFLLGGISHPTHDGVAADVRRVRVRKGPRRLQLSEY